MCARLRVTTYHRHDWTQVDAKAVDDAFRVLYRCECGEKRTHVISAKTADTISDTHPDELD